MRQINEDNKVIPHSGIDREALKKDIYAYCNGTYFEIDNTNNDISYNEDSIFPEMLPVWNAFKKYDFDMDKFMSEKGYEVIEDESDRNDFLMTIYFSFINHPLFPFMPDFVNGYLDFYDRSNSENNEITDTDVLVRLYFCSTEEEIWKMIAEGIGDAECLYKWYKGIDLSSSYEQSIGEPPVYGVKDEKKAAAFLEYLLKPSTEAVAKVRMQAMLLKKMGELYDKLEG